MKYVTFISGKGGTGKSTLVSSLTIIADNKMIADCDVDAPDLHILLQNDPMYRIIKKDDFFGAKKACIDSAACVGCRMCEDVCRFDAIRFDDSQPDKAVINHTKCEGCGACTLVCPNSAISLKTEKTGETYVSTTSRGTFSDAMLEIGAEGSGKLVTEVRRNLNGFEKDEEWALIDGSPGIGCAVIASITGTDAAVAVAEPTKSALSDLKRVLEVTRHFGVPAFVCINKHDLNPEITGEIERFCDENGFPVLGKISFDPAVVKALQKLKTPVEDGNGRITSEIENIWKRLSEEIMTLQGRR